MPLAAGTDTSLAAGARGVLGAGLVLAAGRAAPVGAGAVGPAGAGVTRDGFGASAAAFLRPSLLASRRNGEGPAGGGVDGTAIPGMGRRVAAVETEPADDEVRALRCGAPIRSATLGWPATDSLDLPDSPTQSDSLRVARDTPAEAALGRVSASLAEPAAGTATSGLGPGTARAAAAAAGPAGRASRAGGTFATATGGTFATAAGGTFATAAGALTPGAGGTFAAAAGRALT